VTGEDKAGGRQGSPWRRLARRAALPAAIVVAVAIHAALFLYAEPVDLIFSERPLSGRDYDTHLSQVWRVTEALDGWGKSWSYDVQLLAGNPSGTIFDADNKGWEVFTFALWKLGLPKGLAFNLFLVLAHLLAPWVVFLSARLFGLERWTAVLALFGGLAIWYFDGFVHWAWWEGMVAYSFAAYLCLLPLGLFYRYLKDRRWWQALLLGLVLGAAHLIHPYVFFMLVVPLVALYVRHFRQLGLRHHLSILGVVAFTLAVNSYWLLVAIRFWHYILDSGYLGASTIDTLFTDYLGIVSDRSVTGGAGMRSGFRFLALAAAVVTLLRWRKSRDDRFLPFTAALATMLVATYVGGYLFFMQQVQPYRFVAPAIFIALIPAAQLAAEVRTAGMLRSLPRLAIAFGAVILVAAVPRLVRDVMYFTPVLVPEAEELVEEHPHITDPIGFGQIHYPRPKVFRHGPTVADFDQLVKWINKNTDDSGRIAVEHWELGEHIAWRTRAQVLGGFRLRNIAHSAANLFRRYPIGDPPAEELKEYLQTYSVKWLVSTFVHARFENKPELLEKIADVPPHRVFRSKLPVSFFQQNRGRVAASMNRLEVTGTAPDEDVVLRYHFLETLVCRPGCSLAQEPVPNDPVGFIRVPAPHPSDFTVLNAY
jgi:hypothetical protein